jgi:hypothetical protein
MDSEVETHTLWTTIVNKEGSGLKRKTLIDALDLLPKESVYRVKGFVHLQNEDSEAEESKSFILNWAFGRFDLIPITSQSKLLRLTIMGERGEVGRWVLKLAEKLDARFS